MDLERAHKAVSAALVGYITALVAVSIFALYRFITNLGPTAIEFLLDPVAFADRHPRILRDPVGVVAREPSILLEPDVVILLGAPALLFLALLLLLAYIERLQLRQRLEDA